MIRLFVADVDGTLLNEDSQLEEKTIEAIRRFQRQGGIFMIATGRNSWEVDEITSRIDDAVINCANGAVLIDENGQVICSRFLDEETVRKVIGLCRETGTPVEFHCPDRTCTFWDKQSLKDRAMEVFRRSFDEQGAEEFFRIIFEKPEMCFDLAEEEICRGKVTKAEILFMKDEVRGYLHKCVESLNNCSFSFVDFMKNIEITSDKADKGLAISTFCQIKGIDEKETAVAGDSGNDITMLKRFENSYAMANADEETKKAAKHVCGSNRELGIAKLLNEICDENERI